VSSLRAFSRAHRDVVCLLVGVALLLRILVPAGFMPSLDNGRLVVAICNGVGHARIVLDLPGLEHKRDGQVQSPCAFADLAMPSLSGADPIQLAALIAFVLLLGTVFAIALPPKAAPRLWPPLRGPPLHL
jgi:hypothetical protein